jgi:putative oxidoreductase
MRPFFMHRFEEVTLALLRVVAGLMFMQHGVQKLFGWLKKPDAPPGTVELFSQMGVAGVLEVFGGMLIVLGLFTRPVAFILAGQMAVAYFQAHAPSSPFPILNGGEPAVLFCFIFLYFSARGGGRYSVDHAIGGRSAGADGLRTSRA